MSAMWSGNSLYAADKRYTWLTEGMQDEFESFLSMVSPNGADHKALFFNLSNGVQTNRDTCVYNFQKDILAENVYRLAQTYNAEVDRWHSRTDRTEGVDSFVLGDETKIKWSSRLKEGLQ